jgi:pyruvate/2-oxoglutarate dehydrogenase complex dihydrolipoamide dehydrogenase (E3) component
MATSAKASYDLIVVGGGPAGIIAAMMAADAQARVALIERSDSKGVLLDSGSVPSKSLIRSAGLYTQIRRAASYAAAVPAAAEPDFGAAMRRAREMTKRIGELHSYEHMRRSGVDIVVGAGLFVAKNAIQVDGRRLTFDKAIIATGARPQVPQIDGLAATPYLTSDDIFDLRDRPERLLVVGGGPLGCELGQAFCRLGSHVVIAQNEPKFLPREERDAAQILSESMARDGVEIHLNTTVVAVRPGHAANNRAAASTARKRVKMRSDEIVTDFEVDQILVGTNRQPNVDGLGLEAAGVGYDDMDGIRVDDRLRTSNNRIYAAGDCCMTQRFTHTAAASARVAVRNALHAKRLRFSQLVVPWCTYTDPEIAHVGMQVEEARRAGIPIKTFTILMHDVDRAIIDADENGFLKIHIQDGTDRILGATIVASRAGDMINEITLAMQAKIGLSRLARILHAYPTQALAIKMAADAFVREQTRRR